jgi:hypothetical protein
MSADYGSAQCEVCGEALAAQSRGRPRRFHGDCRKVWDALQRLYRAWDAVDEGRRYASVSKSIGRIMSAGNARRNVLRHK